MSTVDQPNLRQILDTFEVNEYAESAFFAEGSIKLSRLTAARAELDTLVAWNDSLHRSCESYLQRAENAEAEHTAAMELLRQARAGRDELAGRLAELARQEPVAYRWETNEGICGSPLTEYGDVPPGRIFDAVPLYAGPVPASLKPSEQPNFHQARSAGEGGDAIEGQP